jgi:type IV pilus assembly protein PilB
MQGGNSIQIADQAQSEGFDNLRQSALLKAGAGLTSLEEANRLT